MSLRAAEGLEDKPVFTPSLWNGGALPLVRRKCGLRAACVQQHACLRVQIGEDKQEVFTNTTLNAACLHPKTPEAASRDVPQRIFEGTLKLTVAALSCKCR